MNMGSDPTSCGAWGLDKMSSPCASIARWRRFKQHLSQADGREAAQAPPITAPHEYLALNEVEMPPLPRRNLVRSSVYPELPPLKHTPGDTDGPSYGQLCEARTQAHSDGNSPLPAITGC